MVSAQSPPTTPFPVTSPRPCVDHRPTRSNGAPHLKNASNLVSIGWSPGADIIYRICVSVTSTASAVRSEAAVSVTSTLVCILNQISVNLLLGRG